MPALVFEEALAAMEPIGDVVSLALGAWGGRVGGQVAGSGYGLEATPIAKFATPCGTQCTSDRARLYFPINLGYGLPTT
jgi:hypothetical protein